MKLILASQSKARANLLKKLGVPFITQPADIDESVLKGEKPLVYVKRVALAKAMKVAEQNPGCIVLAADTPVAVGRRILQTPQTAEEATEMLRLQSGRRVDVNTVVVVVDANGKAHSKTAISWLKFKVLRESEIQDFIRSNQWKGTSGAIDLEDAAHWFSKIHGSVSGILGLPLYETSLLLQKAGIKVNPHGG